MNLYKKTIITSMIALSSGVYAGTMGPVVTSPPKWYVGVQVGDSISADTHFQPDFGYQPRAERYTTVLPVNTDWTRDFGSEFLAGAFIGYNWTPGLAFQFSYDYRNGYDWNSLNTYGTFFDSDNGPATDRWTAKSLRIQTFLFDMVLKPSVEWGGFVPYVKGGIGVASNRIKGLLNIDIPVSRSAAVGFDSHQEGRSVTNFAWDAGVGADYFFNEKFSVGLGYRLVDVGSIKSGTDFFDPTLVPTPTGLPFTVTPFKTKHLFLNEVTISAAYHFDFA